MRTDTEFASPACSKYEALLEDYFEGALAGAEAKSVAEHLGGCAGCSAAFGEAAASARLLRAASPAVAPSAEFTRSVMATVRAAEEERTAERASFWQPFVSFGWRLAATAALAVIVLATYMAGWGRRVQPNVAALRPTSVNDLFSPDPARSPATSDEVLMMLAEDDHGKH